MNTNNDPNNSQGGTAPLDARAHAALAAYLEPGFERPTGPLRFPFPDDPCVATWHGYRVLANGGPVWSVLQQRLPQLRFAAGPDVSDSAAYRAVTRRGALAEAPALGAPDGLYLSHSDLLRLSIHRTSAGRIPVLEPHGRADFEALLRTFLHKSTPIPIVRSLARGGERPRCLAGVFQGLRRARQAQLPGSFHYSVRWRLQQPDRFRHDGARRSCKGRRGIAFQVAPDRGGA
jgi:hypothetical protein